VVAAPFVVAALDFALMYWVVAAIASLVGVLFVLPGWSVLRLLNRWPVHFGRELHGTPEQQVSRELRRPGI
jgi:hypothetical protein